MDAAAILTEARARLSAALVGWTDATEDPHPAAAAELPAFYVGLSLSDAERVAMGSPAAIRDGELLVTLRAAVASTEDPRGVMWSHEPTARAAILAAPDDLGGLVWSILPGSAEVDAATAAERLGTLDLSFAVQVLT